MCCGVLAMRRGGRQISAKVCGRRRARGQMRSDQGASVQHARARRAFGWCWVAPKQGGRRGGAPRRRLATANSKICRA
uniref:Uncharacterized protein n=1 Tax=Arundo donax TaxID=35708 RepID=A0A0A8Y984_ARUDO